MQNQSPLRLEKKDLTNRNRLVRLLLVLVPLVLLLTVIPWPGSVKQAHAATISCPATIQEGSSGSTVTLLQSVLDLIDQQAFNLTADGQFGPLTNAAVVKFQKAANIQDNGQVGPQTWSELGQCKSSGGISGGGCTTANGLAACISWNAGNVIADGYVRTNLNPTSSQIQLVGAAYGTYYDCGIWRGAPNGYHVTDSECSFSVSSQYDYVSYLDGFNGSSYFLAVSPVQWA